MASGDMRHTSHFSINRPQVKPQNNAARERSRVKTLRSAFLDLQKSLPAVPPNTKLSKLDILVLATAYIFHLTRALEDPDGHGTNISTSREHRRPYCISTEDMALPPAESYAQQQKRPSACNSSNVVYSPTAKDCNDRHQMLSCCGQFHSSNKCQAVDYNAADDDNRCNSFSVSQTSSRPAHECLSVDEARRHFTGAVRILHPVKKWPMRSRLYDSILGCAANSSLMSSSK